MYSYFRVALFLLPFLGGLFLGYEVTSFWYKKNTLYAIERQIELNEKTIKWSRERITELLEKEQKLQEKVNQLEQEAANDPNAARPSLSIDGVRRLNQIR